MNLAVGIQSLLVVASPLRATAIADTLDSPKQVIGQTALVEETESHFCFPARVDTGATTSSLHVGEYSIAGEADEMAKNVGKAIRFRVKNRRGESEWLERTIEAISVIKTSERAERRYKVRLTLSCLDVKKCVLVSLNDRSHMTYPLLLGRNFLQGDFVVDVDLGSQVPPVKGEDCRKTVRQRRTDLDQVAIAAPQKSAQLAHNRRPSRPRPSRPAAELLAAKLPKRKSPGRSLLERKLSQTTSPAEKLRDQKSPEDGERKPVIGPKGPSPAVSSSAGRLSDGATG